MENHALKADRYSSSTLSVSYKSPIILDNLLNTLPDAVIVTDPNFIITGFNPAAEAFYGLPTHDAMGKSLFELAKFDVIDSTPGEAFNELFNKGFWTGTILYHRFNNQTLFFNTRCTLIKDESGLISGIVIINHNITNEVKQEKNLAIAKNKYEIVVESLSEGVLLVNSIGTIDAANKKAGEILGVTQEQLKGVPVANGSWNAIKEDGSPFPVGEYPAVVTLSTGVEKNNVVLGLKKSEGKTLWLSFNSRPIFKEGYALPDAVVISFKDITEIKEANEKLQQSELLFRSFMTNTTTLGWVYDEDSNFVYGNPLFKEIVGLTDDMIGKNLFQISTPKMAEIIHSKNRKVLESGESLISEDELVDTTTGTLRYFQAHWFLLSFNGKKRFVGGHAIEITESKKAKQEMEKMNERFVHALNASSEAVWDLDLVTNDIYRSDAFSNISGYQKSEIEPSLDWWFNKIHSDDQERVKIKMQQCLMAHATHWEDEYRFQYADGSYRILSDKGYVVYDREKPVRLIGSIQDLTERKKIESQLLNEQVHKQRLINQATIKAQEEERNRISAELHDNVNQLLMSSRLHIDVAKNAPDDQGELLSKASEYLLLAVEEIRTLSRELNSSVIGSVGLFKSISDIAYNMKQLNKVETLAEIDESVIARLTAEQQLMVFRVIQEQSNNIIKYAAASEVYITLREKDNMAQLLISDNGKGFDKEDEKTKGIGFINIFNRVNTYDGTVEVLTSPGNGCLLDINFPFTD